MNRWHALHNRVACNTCLQEMYCMRHCPVQHAQLTQIPCLLGSKCRHIESCLQIPHTSGQSRGSPCTRRFKAACHSHTLPADATGGLAEEAPGHTAPKLRGAHARNSAQGVLMRRQTWRTPDVSATLLPMVRNAPSGDRSPPAWRRGTNFFKQNYPDHECRDRPWNSNMLE